MKECDNMKDTQDKLQELISTVRDLCRRLDAIDHTISSGKLNPAVLSDYLNEQNRLKNELEYILTSMDKA